MLPKGLDGEVQDRDVLVDLRVFSVFLEEGSVDGVEDGKHSKHHF